MTDDPLLDPELAGLRARRMRELLERRPDRTVPPNPPARPEELTRTSFFAFLSAHPRAVIDVWAPWCAPCRTMAPILETLAAELAPGVRFGKLNADDEPGLANQWNVSGIPTLLAFQHGRLVDRIVGAQPYGPLKARLSAIYRLRTAG